MKTTALDRRWSNYRVGSIYRRICHTFSRDFLIVKEWRWFGLGKLSMKILLSTFSMIVENLKPWLSLLLLSLSDMSINSIIIGILITGNLFATLKSWILRIISLKQCIWGYKSLTFNTSLTFIFFSCHFICRYRFVLLARILLYLLLLLRQYQ